MEDLLRGVGLLLFGTSMTWFLTMALSRLVARRNVALWVWNRSGSVGRVLMGVGFALAAWGISQPDTPGGSSLVLIGSLLLMAGLWLTLVV